MIQVKEVEKKFDEIKAVSNLTLDIPDGEVFGLVGTNGAGKSTLLRMLCGVLKPDKGSILTDGQNVYENPAVKELFFLIPDEAYFFPNAKPGDIADYYRAVYQSFDRELFFTLLGKFGLSEDRRIKTFSKGMKKQLSLLLGFSAKPRYLLLDETFDGLDPVMRQAVKSLIAGEITKRDFTPIIASHNLRELEDICDRIGLLHEGGILLSKELYEMKLQIHKVQCVIPDPASEEKLLRSLDVVQMNRQGSLLTLTARGSRDEIMNKVNLSDPIFSEVIPLSLEEIFISETEVAGYEIQNILS